MQRYGFAWIWHVGIQKLKLNGENHQVGLPYSQRTYIYIYIHIFQTGRKQRCSRMPKAPLKLIEIAKTIPPIAAMSWLPTVISKLFLKTRDSSTNPNCFCSNIVRMFTSTTTNFQCAAMGQNLKGMPSAEQRLPIEVQRVGLVFFGVSRNRVPQCRTVHH